MALHVKTQRFSADRSVKRTWTGHRGFGNGFSPLGAVAAHLSSHGALQEQESQEAAQQEQKQGTEVRAGTVAR